MNVVICPRFLPITKSHASRKLNAKYCCILKTWNEIQNELLRHFSSQVNRKTEELASLYLPIGIYTRKTAYWCYVQFLKYLQACLQKQYAYSMLTSMHTETLRTSKNTPKYHIPYIRVNPRNFCVSQFSFCLFQDGRRFDLGLPRLRGPHFWLYVSGHLRKVFGSQWKNEKWLRFRQKQFSFDDFYDAVYRQRVFRSQSIFR